LLVVYLFLINYGRAKPDDTQHAIQSFLVVSSLCHTPWRSRAIRSLILLFLSRTPRTAIR
jgi:hypothetical protein